MTDLGYVGAFVGGLLALISPCGALLLPSFFAYAFASRLHLLARTLVFYLGLAAVLVPLGVGSSLASQLFYGHRDQLVTVAGWGIIAMAVLMLSGRSFRWGMLDRVRGQVVARFAARRGWVSTGLLGAVYGLAGFCSGPVLGAVLTVSAFGGDAVRGGALLATYALGMAAPMFLLAWGWDRYGIADRSWLRGRILRLGPVQLHSTSLVAAALLVGIGVVFLRYDGTAALSGVLGVDTLDAEDTAQRWVLEAGRQISDSVALGALGTLVVMLVGGGGFVRLARRRRRVACQDQAPPELRHRRLDDCPDIQ